jgi:hypothetical protein
MGIMRIVRLSSTGAIGRMKMGSRFRTATLMVFLAALLLLQGRQSAIADPSGAPMADTPPPLSGYQTLKIEGWTVFVSERSLSKEKEATQKAIAGLTAQLNQIVRVVPGRATAHLRTVRLWISPQYPDFPPKAEYHPNAQWLQEHGRNPAMAKGVELTNVAIFEQETRRMPMFVLHELAHAYHDQLLGFDNRAIEDVYHLAMADKLYDAVRRNDGQTVRAYAATNAKEYFAETSEAFFGRNDFFPFTREELKEHDPRMYQLLKRIWLRGELPTAKSPHQGGRDAVTPP